MYSSPCSQEHIHYILELVGDATHSTHWSQMAGTKVVLDILPGPVCGAAERLTRQPPASDDQQDQHHLQRVADCGAVHLTVQLKGSNRGPKVALRSLSVEDANPGSKGSWFDQHDITLASCHQRRRWWGQSGPNTELTHQGDFPECWLWLWV